MTGAVCESGISPPVSMAHMSIRSVDSSRTPQSSRPRTTDGFLFGILKNKKPREKNLAGLSFCSGGFQFVLRRPGSDLLSRGLSRSTMGAGGFDGRVRYGIG